MTDPANSSAEKQNFKVMHFFAKRIVCKLLNHFRKINRFNDHKFVLINPKFSQCIYLNVFKKTNWGQKRQWSGISIQSSKFYHENESFIKCGV